MITINKAPGIPTFGTLIGDPKVASHLPNAPHIELTDLGICIQNRLKNIHTIDKALQIFRYVIMPDHIHFILYVSKEIKEHVGSYIGIIKGQITNDLWDLYPYFKTSKISAFERNYNDRILLQRNRLETMKKYLDDNPRRLAIRRLYPNFFRRLSGITIRGESFDFFGNPFLLYQYSKVAVKVRSRWSSTEFEERRTRWHLLMRNGAILVSPFISERERIIRDDAIRMGRPLIIVRNESFPKRFKPSGEYFRLCSEGKLLLIAPAGLPIHNPDMTREMAEQLNGVATMLAELSAEETVIHTN